MNLREIKDMVNEGYVSERKHPEEDLYIYNYTPQAQYEQMWNDTVMACRGLILDGKGNIVSRPFRKFFNLEEHNGNFPNEPFEVTEKLDGSLGILYWLKDKPFIATRGSFESEQAIKGSDMIRNYSYFRKDRTYLFEIIYPDNRIVVDYGDMESLILLAVIDNNTGKDLPLKDVGFPIRKSFDGITDISKLKDMEEDNKEGFVIRFEGGFRAKAKFDEYVRLHRILTNVSNKSIWEILKDGQSMDDILERVPDEFYEWVKTTKHNLLGEYADIENQAKAYFKDLGDRKENALYYEKFKYPPILFNMLDGKDYSELIWKIVRPKYEKPFKTEA